MAKVEVTEEVARRVGETPATQILIGIPGPVDVAQLAAAITAAIPDAYGAGRLGVGAGSIAVAFPQSGAGAEEELASGIRLVPYEPQGPVHPQLSWMPQGGAYGALFHLTEVSGAGACVVIHPDLKACAPDAIEALLRPVLNQECDLLVPVYPAKRFEGLLNFGILEPVARALYGRRVQSPLPPDFAISRELAARISRGTGRNQAGPASLLWPATEAVAYDRVISEAHLPVHHEFSGEGVDLTAILIQLVGPLFADAERHAAVWQRVRGSQAVVVHGLPTQVPEDGHAIDTRPMVEAFQLGQRNLQEVWGMVLPPVTLLELKKLTRQSPETFKMPDELWAKIIYDFMLAQRLRTIGRNHLMGALTPLYLGWVASYAREVSGLPESGLGLRRERVQRAFEETKPYLVQRWRWPDRFNP